LKKSKTEKKLDWKWKLKSKRESVTYVGGRL